MLPSPSVDNLNDDDVKLVTPPLLYLWLSYAEKDINEYGLETDIGNLTVSL